MDGSGLMVLTQAAWHTEAAATVVERPQRLTAGAAAAREGLELVSANIPSKGVRRVRRKFKAEISAFCHRDGVALLWLASKYMAAR